MNTETFDFEETTEAKRFTVVLDGDTNVSEEDARRAIDALVEDSTGVTEDTTGEDKDDSVRSFDRGYEC